VGCTDLKKSTGSSVGGLDFKKGGKKKALRKKQAARISYAQAFVGWGKKKTLVLGLADHYRGNTGRKGSFQNRPISCHQCKWGGNPQASEEVTTRWGRKGDRKIVSFEEGRRGGKGRGGCKAGGLGGPQERTIGGERVEYPVNKQGIDRGEN